MIVICQGYSAKQLPNNGGIELTITQPQAEPASDRLNLAEIAMVLGKSTKAVDRLSRRKKNPLPVIRGNGRPYGFRSQLSAWLARDGRFPMGMGNHVSRLINFSRDGFINP